MRITKKIMVEQEATCDIICNKCGESCCRPADRTEDERSEHDAYGLIEATVTGGYYSSNGAIQDCKEYTFSICEPCVSLLFGTFKIPPSVRGPFV